MSKITNASVEVPPGSGEHGLEQVLKKLKRAVIQALAPRRPVYAMSRSQARRLKNKKARVRAAKAARRQQRAMVVDDRGDTRPQRWAA